MSKPIICIDFDGVIHSYENGWQNGEIYGNATPGFFTWLVKAVDHFQVVIYSSRSKTIEGRQAMADAIGRWAVEWAKDTGGALQPGEDPDYLLAMLEFSDVKPPAFLTIDDRAICFDGNWKALDPAELTQFRTWVEINRDASAHNAFVDDWNKMVDGIAALARKYQLPEPQMVFHPKWIDRMNEIAGIRLAPVIIYKNVKIRFGRFEQMDVLQSL